MILQEIQTKLEELDPKVFYGMVDETVITNEWNYIVFSRKALSASNNRTGYSDRFTVAVIREGYIPEDFDIAVIEKMCEISGMKLASPDSQYTYVQKPNTNTVVELLTMEFVRARKRDVA